MNRTDLQKLAEERLSDAKVLLTNGRFGGAAYLAGYVVECALKACIAKLAKPEEFPDRAFAAKVYTHNLEKLAEAARMDVVIKRLSDTDVEFGTYWLVVNMWTEESRYETSNEGWAKLYVEAVSDPEHRVLQCIRQHW